MPATPALVSSDWLFKRLGDANIRIVDGSFKMPGVTPDAQADYATAHIPGAVFFDIEEIADKSSPLPHMLPSAEEFGAHMARLGIGNKDHVIVYDVTSIVGAARVWWTLRAFGHETVSVLKGGLGKWIDRGFPVTTDVPAPNSTTFNAVLNPALVRDWRKVFGDQASGQEQIVDARDAARFRGETAEVRPGLRSGHIPASINVEYRRLIDPATASLRNADEVGHIFESSGVDLERPIVTTCGSGVTACVLALALHTAGVSEVAVYDGSWSEWGAPTIPQGWTTPLPIETGPSKPALG